MAVEHQVSPSIARAGQVARLHQILDRHVRDTDAQLTDRGLVEEVMHRFVKHMASHIVDVNE